MGYKKVDGRWVKTADDPRFVLKSKSTREQEKLLELAKKSGLGAQGEAIVNKPRKLSTLQRIAEGVNIFNPTGALYRKSVGKESDVFVGYVKDIAQRTKAAFTGEIPNRQIETGADLASAFGINNKLAKPVVGFLADVLLDPTTYIPGGVLLKAGGKIAKVPLKGLEVVGKAVSPAGVEATKVAATGIKDALGKAFVRGYKATPGLLDETTDVLGKTRQIQRDIVQAEQEKLIGTTGVERTELGKKTSAIVDERLAAEEATRKKYVEEWNRITGKKAEDISFSEADRLLKETEQAAAKKSDRLQRTIEYLQRDITKNETSDLQKLINELNDELRQSTGKKTATNVAEKTTFKETEQFLTSTINLRRRELQEAIGALTAKVKSAKAGTKAGETAAKVVKESFSEKISRLNRELVRVQNDAVARQRVLGGIKSSRQIARAGVDKLKPIIRKDLSPTAQGVVERLLKAGKQVPEAFRDLRLERIQAEQVAAARQRGGKLVAAGQLAEETPPNVYFPKSAKPGAQPVKEIGGRRIGPGGQTYLKRLRGELSDDAIELDIGKAYGLSAAKIEGDIFLTKKLKDIVGKYGKKFSSETEAKAAGYVPINSKGLASTMGETIGYVTKEDADLLGAMMGKQEFETLDAMAKALGFDALTGLFKRSVTGPFAAFHVRNWMSGVVQNFEVLGPRALNPVNMARGFRLAKRILQNKAFKKGEIIELAGKKYEMETIRQAIQNRFFGGSSAADLMDQLNFLTDNGKVFSSETLKKTAGFQKGNWLPLVSKDAMPLQMARKVGETIEMQQKSTAVMTALEQGKSLDEALSLAKEAGFDYRQLTGFESKVLRRIIPFYAFARFNAELQVKTLMKNPGRIAAVVKIAQNAGQATQEERESMPEFLQKTFGIRAGTDKYGNPQFISSLGTPVEAFADWIDKDPIFKIIANMNPIIKVPTEIGIGKDTFRKRDIKDVYTAREFSSAPQIVKDLLQIKPVEKVRFENGKPTKEKYTVYVANPYRLLIARSLPTSRGITFLDQAFDGDVKGLNKALNLMTGVKTVPLDVERYAELKERDVQRELEDLLIRYGVAREFRSVYTPKVPFNPYKK